MSHKLKPILIVVKRDSRGPQWTRGAGDLKEPSHLREPCCIILDLMMPVMTGEEFIYHIQALNRVELDSNPIIVSSA